MMRRARGLGEHQEDHGGRRREREDRGGDEGAEDRGTQMGYWQDPGGGQRGEQEGGETGEATGRREGMTEGRPGEPGEATMGSREERGGREVCGDNGGIAPASRGRERTGDGTRGLREAGGT